ncbi:MAG: NUDIX domain-containing protein [Rhodospirillaceae bacterium]|nr:NUDIX domain-containing protein [Rhodospirillaceae bacterium]MBT5565091.1 NUDIX domain-containing protein [Rhodospirillaceae bacterium]MBT6088113.1 NUDIX domain-containing protein [Rhodospirillaceae bacterium]MBT6961153.1 NUDIX domain-containing protein [Rhodospirillaceae bacterium]MBT7452022.1 NUDIX domain-containing protein [Rhodospirillaceae bacterium]
MKRLLSGLFRLIPTSALRLGIFLANAKFNQGAVAVITNDEGHVLLLRHVFRKSYPWGFPSGFVNVGENAAAAALRELKEETGLQAMVIHVGATALVAPRHLETVVYGHVRVVTPIKLSHEIFEARWVVPDQVSHDVVQGLRPDQLALLLAAADPES